MDKEKEREIEILEYKISKLDEKILVFLKNNINEVKTKKLESKKFKYLDKLNKLKNR